MFSYESSSYLVSSPKGKIHVPRVRADLPTEPQPGTSQQALDQNPPDQRQLRTKMKTKGNKPRSTSVHESYPVRVQERLIRARAAIEAEENERPNSPQVTETDNSSEGPRSVRHNLRDSHGKFMKKSRGNPPSDDT